MIFNALAIILILLAVFNLFSGFKALRRVEPINSIAHLTISISFFAVGFGCLLGFMTLKGYQAFTHEALAAKVTITPIEDSRFLAKFEFNDGSTEQYTVEGDELYVDAQILKWRPLANFIGLHTSYQLARVGGRYYSIEDERNKPRSLFALTEENELDLFKVRKKFSHLSFLVDAEYGSASFIAAKGGHYLLLVSTSGLLFKKTTHQ